MREIRFRGKRTDALAKDEWVYGLPVYNRDCTGIDKIEVPRKAGSICRLVDPATVGQYTGLPDANGNDIYDGDITEDEFGRVATVFWKADEARFAMKYGKEKTAYRMFINHLTVRVIGNRWDTPEGRTTL